MSCFIHPNKGYLNTQFSLFHDGIKEETFIVQKVNDSSKTIVLNAQPNIPSNISFEEAGQYELFCGGESIQELTVENGYKFGGSSFKNAFLFEDTPWVFVVMHDRTYFHNRETGREYVEVISPDNIESVSDSYVILSNGTMLTLYSLKDECPLLSFENIVFKNKNVVIWQENDEKVRRICGLELSKHDNVKKWQCEDYIVLESTSQIFLSNDGMVSVISFDDFSTKSSLDYFGKFISFLDCGYLVSQEENQLLVLNLKDFSTNKINFTGILANVNGRELTSRGLSSVENQINETEKYVTYELLPSQMIFSYIEKIEEVSSQKEKKEKLQSIFLCNDKGVRIEKRYIPEIRKYGDLVCAFVDHTLYVVGNTSSRFLEYNHVLEMYHSDFGIYVIISERGNKSLCHVSQSGAICPVKEIRLAGNRKYSFADFADFGVLRLDGDILYSLDRDRANRLGKYISTSFYPFHRVNFDGGIVLFGGRVLNGKFDSRFTSELGNWNLKMKDEKFFLCAVRNGVVRREWRILGDILDTSFYHNVLFSEDGTKMLSRTNEGAKLLDIRTGKTEGEYQCQHYVSHVEGMRPYFICNECRQVRFINPLSGTEIDIDKISQYNFISPKGTYYADTRLEEYVEYYDKIKKKNISRQEYLSINQKYSYQNNGECGDGFIAQERKKFIIRYLDFFRKLECGDVERKTEQEIIDKYLGRNISFADKFIEKRGVAVIRRTADDVISHRIYLGIPLWFLNYVTFSQDENYVAIAGRYPNGCGKGGLLLVYDLIKHEVVYQEDDTLAVWTVAFSKSDKLGAYTSSPNTFLGEAPFPKIEIIEGYSFLAFSPKGDLVALSEQGYTAWNKGRNPYWGHQPSCLVSIRKVESPKEEVCRFEDLSNKGIAGTYEGKTVSSVSFSNDSKYVMMVGKDGVVVIRYMSLEVIK